LYEYLCVLNIVASVSAVK